MPKKKSLGGRPTDYSEEIVKKAKDYLANYEALGEAVPTVAGLALQLGVVKSTIYDWAKHKDKQEFSDTLDNIQQEQEKKLTSLGLTGKFNSVITKLMLSNHGYSDRQEIDHTTKGESIKGITEEEKKELLALLGK